MEKITTRDITLEVDSAKRKLLVKVCEPHLANKVNRAMGRYYDTIIRQGEEPLFRVSEPHISPVLDVLPKEVSKVVSSFLNPKSPEKERGDIYDTI